MHPVGIFDGAHWRHQSTVAAAKETRDLNVRPCQGIALPQPGGESGRICAAFRRIPRRRMPSAPRCGLCRLLHPAPEGMARDHTGRTNSACLESPSLALDRRRRAGRGGRRRRPTCHYWRRARGSLGCRTTCSTGCPARRSGPCRSPSAAAATAPPSSPGASPPTRPDPPRDTAPGCRGGGR